MKKIPEAIVKFQFLKAMQAPWNDDVTRAGLSNSLDWCIIEYLDLVHAHLSEAGEFGGFMTQAQLRAGENYFNSLNT